MVRRPVLIEQRGSALVITLLIITTLVGLTLAFSEDSSVELGLAGYSRNSYRAYQMALAGCALARAVLEKDQEEMQQRPFDSLREPWAKIRGEDFPEEILQGGVLAISIVDENGKFNVNAVRNDSGQIREIQSLRLSRLFRVLDLQERDAVPILDWLDADDERRLEGAENYYYESLVQPYPCGNGPFLTIGQLFLVKGMVPLRRFGEEKRTIQDFVTIYSDGRININTAPPEVLECLDESVDRATAEAIVEYRKDQDFTKIEDLMNVPSVTDQIYSAVKNAITVKSTAFSFAVEGRYQEASCKIKAVLLRKQEGSKLVYWQVS